MSLDDLSVTAHHEAAHAVAVVMTGSTLVSVSIRSTRSRHGGTAWRGERCHAAFVAYAGAWAEARFQWRGHSLDALDDSGLSFDDHVTRVFLENTCDLWAYQQETGGSRSLIDEAVWRVFQPDYEVTTNRVVPQDLAWHHDLERHWPIIEHVAVLLMTNLDADPVANARVITKVVGEFAKTAHRAAKIVSVNQEDA